MKLNFSEDQIIYVYSTGQIDRRYVLMMISCFSIDRNKTFDGRKIRLLENLLMTWKNQIQSVINYENDPSTENTYQMPNMEIEFWMKRAVNLQGIQNQVFENKTRKINQRKLVIVDSFADCSTFDRNSRSIRLELFLCFPFVIS